MSGYKTHLLFYLMAALLTLTALERMPYERSQLVDLTAVALGAAYAILPDIDAARSKARSLAMRGLGLLALLAAAGYALTKDRTFAMAGAASASTMCLLMLSRHRGALHSATSAIILSAPIALLSPYHALWALLGYGTHLLLDGNLSH
jgi:hypothetical protein